MVTRHRAVRRSGTAVGATGGGQWIKFAGSDLGSATHTFAAQVARASAGTTTIQIRLYNPVTGPAPGTATVPGTGDVYTYSTATASLTGAHGRANVCLVFNGDLRIASFSLK